MSDHKFTFFTGKFGNIERLDEKAPDLSLTDSEEKLKIFGIFAMDLNNNDVNTQNVSNTNQ